MVSCAPAARRFADRRVSNGYEATRKDGQIRPNQLLMLWISLDGDGSFFDGALYIVLSMWFVKPRCRLICLSQESKGRGSDEVELKAEAQVQFMEWLHIIQRCASHFVIFRNAL